MILNMYILISSQMRCFSVFNGKIDGTKTKRLFEQTECQVLRNYPKWFCP